MDNTKCIILILSQDENLPGLKSSRLIAIAHCQCDNEEKMKLDQPLDLQLYYFDSYY